MSWTERDESDVERLHDERMSRIERDQEEARRVLRVLADQVRLLRQAVGLPPDLTELG